MVVHYRRQEVLSGVPKWSFNSWTSTFTTFVNDLLQFISSSVFMFADTKLIHSITVADHILLQADLDCISLLQWCDKWQLIFHISNYRIAQNFNGGKV